MKCPSCGYENPEGGIFCNFCGNILSPAPAAPTPQPSSYQSVPPPTPVEHPRQCISCGRSISWTANVCPYCGHDFRPPTYSYPQKETLSSDLRIVLYIVSFLIPIAGIIIGIIYYLKPDPEMKRFGRNCIIIAVLVWSVALVLVIAIFAATFGSANLLSLLCGTILR